MPGSRRRAQLELAEIVAWTLADDTALCALTALDGRVWAAANTRLLRRSVAHIRYHVARGFTGTLVCSVFCREN